MAAAAAGRLAGRRGLVTGAGSGIGAACARRLAAEGAALWLLDAREDAVAAVADELRAAGAGVAHRACDVADPEAVTDAVAAAAADLDGLDLVVTAAGITRPGATHELALDEWDLMIRVNLTGTFLPLRAALPHLVAAGHSAVVTIGSVASFVAAGTSASYDAAKGGVLQLTRGIAVEYADRGVRACCVCPGMVATDLGRSSAQLHGRATGTAKLTALDVPVPQARSADPAEVAAAVAFLASEEASFVTGAALAVDGGYLAV